MDFHVLLLLGIFLQELMKTMTLMMIEEVVLGVAMIMKTNKVSMDLVEEEDPKLGSKEVSQD